MWIYIPFFRSICKKKYQNDILNNIENTAETKQVKNKSGRWVTKHKATLKQFGVINVGISKF